MFSASILTYLSSFFCQGIARLERRLINWARFFAKSFARVKKRASQRIPDNDSNIKDNRGVSKESISVFDIFESYRPATRRDIAK